MLLGCQSDKKTEQFVQEENPDTISVENPVETKTHQNQRFNDVTVLMINDSLFRIKGKAQIFEANFGWFVEDGHNILAEGFEMTDAGAPEWGNFDFTVSAKKARENSTLHIILFETSARDGSKQYELPVPVK